jgi:mono/diheme cytochrome c family protein
MYASRIAMPKKQPQRSELLTDNQQRSMKKLIILAGLLCTGLLFSNLTFKKKPPAVTADMPVAEVLAKLGDVPSPHLPKTDMPGVSALAGKELVLYGSAINSQGQGGTRISRHFVCTSCHNVERDEPDLRVVDPLARLNYVKEKRLPFLQGSALYGIVNRSVFYNGDYEKKYGDLVAPARNDLRQAIQLCATECSQGRLLKDWELESVLAYLWTIGLNMGDLNLPDSDVRSIDAAVQGAGDKSAALTLVKSRFLPGMPATFIDPPKDRKEGYAATGNPETGKLLYELSCLHCHQDKRYSFFNLDDSKLSLDFLDRHFPAYTRYSVYQVGRYGTSPMPWKRAYMPQYTKEKMSEQMMEDLRAYVGQRSDQ